MSSHSIQNQPSRPLSPRSHHHHHHSLHVHNHQRQHLPHHHLYHSHHQQQQQQQHQHQQIQNYLNLQQHLSAPPPPVGSADWIFNPLTQSWMGRAEYEAITCAAAHGYSVLPAAGPPFPCAEPSFSNPSAAYTSNNNNAPPHYFTAPQPQPQQSGYHQQQQQQQQQWHVQTTAATQVESLEDIPGVFRQKTPSNATSTTTTTTTTTTSTSQAPPPLPPMETATPTKDVTPWPTFTPGVDSHISNESNPFVRSKPKPQPKPRPKPRPKSNPLSAVQSEEVFGFVPPEVEGYDDKLERWKAMGDDEFVMVDNANDER